MGPLERRASEQEREVQPPVSGLGRSAGRENDNQFQDSMHAVQLPVPVIPNLSRGQGADEMDDDDDDSAGEEPRVYEEPEEIAIAQGRSRRNF